MTVETVNDLASWIADKLGIYGTCEDVDHQDDCKCRICFETEMAERIRQAVRNEKRYYMCLCDNYLSLSDFGKRCPTCGGIIGGVK